MAFLIMATIQRPTSCGSDIVWSEGANHRWPITYASCRTELWFLIKVVAQMISANRRSRNKSKGGQLTAVAMINYRHFACTKGQFQMPDKALVLLELATPPSSCSPKITWHKRLATQ